MAHINLEEDLSPERDQVESTPTQWYPKGYGDIFQGVGDSPGTVAATRGTHIPDVKVKAKEVAQSRQQPFYFSIQQWTFRAMPNGDIETGIVHKADPERTRYMRLLGAVEEKQ